MIHSSYHAESQNIRRSRQSRRARCKYFIRHEIGNNNQLTCRYAIFSQLVGRCLAVADDAVCHAKHHRVRELLNASEHVANSAMTSNDHSYTGGSRGRNQQHVAVEVERMCDIHLVLSEVSSEEPRRLPCLPTNQRISGVEFRNRSNRGQQRTLARRATKQDLELLAQSARGERELALRAAGLQRLGHQEYASEPFAHLSGVKLAGFLTGCDQVSNLDKLVRHFE